MDLGKGCDGLRHDCPDEIEGRDAASTATTRSGATSRVCDVAVKAVSALLASGILLAGCSQVIDRFYSKENFNMRSFNADISECKEQNPSVVAMHIDAAESREQVDDAMVRECMKAKGYAVQIETK
jgi:hypothetical protein